LVVIAYRNFPRAIKTYAEPKYIKNQLVSILNTRKKDDLPRVQKHCLGPFCSSPTTVTLLVLLQHRQNLNIIEIKLLVY
jgi:hypothetical protein